MKPWKMEDFHQRFVFLAAFGTEREALLDAGESSVATVSHPETANRTLAFIARLLIRYSSMLICAHT